MLDSFVRDLEICKHVWCSGVLLIPPKTAWKFSDILQEMVWLFFIGCWAVYLSRHLEKILSFTFAVSCVLWSFFCKFVPSPAELNAAALRAGLLCCHVNCACHLFTFDLAEHFMIRTKASGDFELGVTGQGHSRMGSEEEGLLPPSAGCPPDEQREQLPGTLSS